MKLAFAGTPAFAAIALGELHAAGFDIPLVLTQPDRPAGRGMKLQASPVKAFAQAHRITLAQPRSLRLDGKAADEAATAQAALVAAAPDVIVVAAYGLILPAWVLALPRLGCINIHASLLPRWRGAAPIQRAIEAGDTLTGITIMQMDAGLDTGDMLAVEVLTIAPDDSAATLHDRLAVLGGRMIIEMLRRAAHGPLDRSVQPSVGVSYAHKIEKSEAAIDWRDSAAVIERRIRAFDPFPGASALLGGEVVKCWRARLGTGQGVPGDVLRVADDGVSVACGAGSLLLTELQRPGGKRLPARAFLQGMAIAPGQRFAPRLPANPG